MERRLGVVRLSDSVAVEGLKVNSTSRFSRFFGADDHPMAPCDWGAYRHFLYNAQALVLIQTRLDVLVPMNRHWDRCVVGYGARITVDHEAKWWRRHHREWLMSAGVESARPVIF